MTKLKYHKVKLGRVGLEVGEGGARVELKLGRIVEG